MPVSQTDGSEEGGMNQFTAGHCIGDALLQLRIHDSEMLAQGPEIDAFLAEEAQVGLWLNHGMKTATDELDERALAGPIRTKNRCGLTNPELQCQVLDDAMTSRPGLDSLKIQPWCVSMACVLMGHGVIVAAEPMGS